MIATIAALAMCLQEPNVQDPSSSKAAQLLSKMLSHYYKVKKLSGRILLTTTAGKVSGKLLTTVQFEDPSKLFIRQDLQANTKGTWLVISDGDIFTYPLPNSQLGSETGKSLVERVLTDGEQRSFRDIYAIAAGGLKDRSAPLDLAIGRYEDMKIFRGHLANHTLGLPEQVNGQVCDIVQGDWRIVPNAPAESRYRIWISSEGDIMRYELVDKILNPEAPSTMIDIKQVWDVDLHVNGETNEALYRVR